MIGHKLVQEALARTKSRTILLLGPESVGKRTMLEEHAGEFTSSSVPLTVGEVKYIADRTKRVKDSYVIDLAKAQRSAVDMLLPLLEKPPRGSKFYLYSSLSVPRVVQSRCETYHVGYLTTSQVAQVLEEQGVDSADAMRWATGAGGTVQGAYDRRDAEVLKVPLVSLFKAIRDYSPEVFSMALSGVDERHVKLLRKWATEALSKNWRLFEADDDAGLSARHPEAPDAIWVALDREARPRVAVRAALLPYLTRDH